MAQTAIARTCGHSTIEQLYGPGAERTRKAAWLATQPCRECARQAATVAAVKATADLPALTGSDKQVAWATTIRAKLVADLKTFRAEVDARAAKFPGPDADEFLAVADKAIAAIESKTDARFWIDNRTSWGEEMVKNEMRRMLGK